MKTTEIGDSFKWSDEIIKRNENSSLVVILSDRTGLQFMYNRGGPFGLDYLWYEGLGDTVWVKIT